MPTLAERPETGKKVEGVIRSRHSMSLLTYTGGACRGNWLSGQESWLGIAGMTFIPRKYFMSRMSGVVVEIYKEGMIPSSLGSRVGNSRPCTSKARKGSRFPQECEPSIGIQDAEIRCASPAVIGCGYTLGKLKFTPGTWHLAPGMRYLIN